MRKANGLLPCREGILARSSGVRNGHDRAWRKRYAARLSPKQTHKSFARMRGHQPSTHRWSSATGACPLFSPLFSSRPDLVLMFDESPVRQLIQFSGLECFRPAPQLACLFLGLLPRAVLVGRRVGYAPTVQLVEGAQPGRSASG